jgi:signal transduction histidine kinase
MTLDTVSIFNLDIVNLDLLAVGIMTAAAGTLGFVVFFNNPKSATSRAFLFFSFATIAYTILNYLQHNVNPPSLALWFLRGTIFMGVWHALSFFHFFFNFPKEKTLLPKWYTLGLIPITALVSLINLTPFTFSDINKLSLDGKIVSVTNGPGIAIFGITVFALIIGGIFILIKKWFSSKGFERRQFNFILFGTVMTFTLILIFNFMLPVVYNNSGFVPLVPISLSIFLVFTAYAIIRHHLLNIKVISTEILAFVLATVTFIEIIFADNIFLLIFRSATFLLVLSFGILIIKSVLREVEQREKLQELATQLATANKKLNELSQFKTQLLSLASHQIKSPLAVIKGFTSILLEGLYGPIEDKVKETIIKIKESADSLLSLINTLLDLRKVEEGRMDYQFAPTDLVAIIKQVVGELQLLASARKLNLSLDYKGESIMISSDSQKLKQVFQNLVDNSIKYTPQGFIKIDIKTQDNKVIVSIINSGLGISEELIPQLFEEFVRDEKIKRQILGTGLGLYIARRIVEAHHGRIWAESDGEGDGKGARFYVELVKA